MNALAFDVTNACAGTFTAHRHWPTAICGTGVIRRAMVVSGEYITHLTRDGPARDRELHGPAHGVPDARRFRRGHDLWSRRQHATSASRRSSCTPSASTTTFAWPRCTREAARRRHHEHRPGQGHRRHHQAGRRPRRRGPARKHWQPENDRRADHAPDLGDDAGRRGSRDQPRARQASLPPRQHDVQRRRAGNTATNTHFLAVWERIQAGDIEPGDRVVFAVSGSGQTVGTALYIFDDLPVRLREPAGPLPEKTDKPARCAS